MCSSDSESKPAIALVGGTLIDGGGAAPLRDAAILIRGNKIVEVGSKNEIEYAAATRILDVTGKYILPGLIDIHVHCFDWMGELFLAHGVTTVKDLGNDFEWISTVSAEVEQGKVRGPRIFYVGNGLDASPPDRDTHVGLDSPEIARHAVEILHSGGASAIKVREKITPELLRVIIEEAHKFGMLVTGHIRRTNAREAALAGIDGLEHLSGFVEAIGNCNRQEEPAKDARQILISDLKAYSAIDLAKAEELINLLVDKRVALVPTMPIWWRIASDWRDDFAREDAEYAKNAALVYVPEDVRKQWASSLFYKLDNANDLAQIQSGYKKLRDLLVSHHRAGGKILAGSDTFFSVPGLSLHRELMLLVDAGFSPLQAISFATHDNAEFLGKGAALGTIVPGKLADILVVSANPLDDIRNTQRVALVIKDGQVVDTSYHANYSIPTPRPKLSRPLWLEKRVALN